MDPRRKRAVIIASLPAVLTGAFLMLSKRATGNHTSQIVLGIWLLFVICCFIVAMRNIIALKRDGNPY